MHHDPAIQGGFWTACARTRYLSVDEVSEWQNRLFTTINDPDPEWQGIDGIVAERALRQSAPPPRVSP
jgi:hypothetical protein